MIPAGVIAPFSSDELRPLAADIFCELRRISFDGVGVTRESFGPLENAAQEVIARVAAENGLEVEHDRARNLIVTLPGRETAAPFMATGSHLDSVPHGGNYDGAAGVVEQFPKMGRPFRSHQTRSVESQAAVERLKTRTGGAEIKEYLMDGYLILYALIGDAVYLLSIRHHQQLSFDLEGFWPK